MLLLLLLLLLAALLALLAHRLPEVHLNETPTPLEIFDQTIDQQNELENDKFIRHEPFGMMSYSVSRDDSSSMPIPLHYLPIHISFAFLSRDGEVLILDPDRSEELSSRGRIDIAMNNRREILAIAKVLSSDKTTQKIQRQSIKD